MESKNCLILGAAGYIGSTLTDILLKNNFKVHAVDNFYKGTCDTLLSFVPNKNFSFSFGDVTNPADMERLLDKADVICLLSSLVGFPICRQYPALAKLTNIEGMRNVLAYRRNNSILIFPSTCSVYGNVENGYCDENHPTIPLSLYGETKLEAERLALSEDNTIVFRLATAFGVGHGMTRVNLLPNTLCYEAVINKSIVVYEEDFRRTFLHVRDICNAFLYCINNFSDMYNKYRLYNVGNNDLNMSKKQLCEKIKEKTDCQLVYAPVNVDLDKRNYYTDFSRIYNAGWKPVVDIETGLDELIKISPMLTPWNRYN